MATEAQHVVLEGDPAAAIDALRPMAPGEAEEALDGAHARPRQRRGEEAAREGADHRAELVGLALEEVDVSHGVGSLVLREVVGTVGEWDGRGLAAEAELLDGEAVEGRVGDGDSLALEEATDLAEADALLDVSFEEGAPVLAGTPGVAVRVRPGLLEGGEDRVEARVRDLLGPTARDDAVPAGDLEVASDGLGIHRPPRGETRWRLSD